MPTNKLGVESSNRSTTLTFHNGKFTDPRPVHERVIRFGGGEWCKGVVLVESDVIGVAFVRGMALKH